MPCIYPIHLLLGRFGSFFFRYKYSAIWFQTPILVNFYTKINLAGEKERERERRATSCFLHSLSPLSFSPLFLPSHPAIKKRSPGRIRGRSHKKPKLLLYEREILDPVLIVTIPVHRTKKRTEQEKKTARLASGAFS
jgi:hypothetical protein